MYVYIVRQRLNDFLQHVLLDDKQLTGQLNKVQDKMNALIGGRTLLDAIQLEEGLGSIGAPLREEYGYLNVAVRDTWESINRIYPSYYDKFSREKELENLSQQKEASPREYDYAINKVASKLPKYYELMTTLQSNLDKQNLPLAEIDKMTSDCKKLQENLYLYHRHCEKKGLLTNANLRKSLDDLNTMLGKLKKLEQNCLESSPAKPSHPADDPAVVQKPQVKQRRLG